MNYEYRYLALAAPGVEKNARFSQYIREMEDLTRQGWELDHTIPLERQGECNSIQFVFKRGNLA